MRAYDGIKANREVNLERPDFLEQARQQLSRSIPLEIRMSGGTMRPAIEDGDLITILPVGDTAIKPGDIVLYQSRFDTAVIHRVVRIDRSSSERMIVTRGDAASQSDMPVPLHRILGVVKSVRRAGENVNMARSRKRLSPRLSAFLRKMKFWSND
ncbi:MAG: signal peptidase I [Blastocatellia bacterium]|nr:signal peptidase I [Blastocatellia bacterium]